MRELSFEEFYTWLNLGNACDPSGGSYYKVTEQERTTYITTYSEGCEGDITLSSQREDCTITNTATGDGILRIGMHIQEEGCRSITFPFPSGNSFCPNARQSDFTITVIDSERNTYVFDGIRPISIPLGNSEVFWRYPAGEWIAETDGNCSGFINAGDSIECFIIFRGICLPPLNLFSELFYVDMSPQDHTINIHVHDGMAT